MASSKHKSTDLFSRGFYTNSRGFDTTFFLIRDLDTTLSGEGSGDLIRSRIAPDDPTLEQG
jgi:hypothetical protein